LLPRCITWLATPATKNLGFLGMFISTKEVIVAQNHLKGY